MRQLYLSYGVFSGHIQKELTSAKPSKKAICLMLAEKQFKDEDLIIVLAGSFGAKHEASFLRFQRLKGLLHCGSHTRICGTISES